jgi:hypothetical protein
MTRALAEPRRIRVLSGRVVRWSGPAAVRYEPVSAANFNYDEFKAYLDHFRLPDQSFRRARARARVCCGVCVCVCVSVCARARGCARMRLRAAAAAARFSFVLHRYSMAEDPSLALAFEKSMRSAVVPTLGTDGTFSAAQRMCAPPSLAGCAPPS